MNLSQFHDSELIKIEISDDRDSLILAFKLSSSRKVTVALSGVLEFRVLDFVMQNVVLSLIRSDSSISPDGEIIKNVEWLRSFSDFNYSIGSGNLTKLIKRVETGDLILFVLEPSRGAKLMALCKSIEMDQE